MLHTSLYMYIAKFLNVCIRTQSLSRPSCIPYLRMYFGSDTCERVSVKKREQKKKTRICSRGKARLTLSLSQARMSYRVATNRRDMGNPSFATVFSVGPNDNQEAVSERVEGEVRDSDRAPVYQFTYLRSRGTDPISIATEGHDEKKREELRYYKSSRAHSSSRISRRNRSGQELDRAWSTIRREGRTCSTRARPHIRSGVHPPIHPSRPAPPSPLVINLHTRNHYNTRVHTRAVKLARQTSRILRIHA